MKGKILGAGAISGEDGVRYYYDEKELKNLKEGQKLEGCEVDFDIKDGKAVGVYIVKGSGFNADFGKVGANVSASLKNANLPSFDSKFVFWDLNEAKANLIGANMHSVKLWFLVATLFGVIGWLVGMGNRGTDSSADFVLQLISFVLCLWGVFCLGKPSGSYKPFKYQLFLLVLVIVLGVFLVFIFDDYQKMFFGGKPPYVKIIFATIFAAITIYVAFLFFKALSIITNEKFFMVSFIVAMIAFVFAVIEVLPVVNSMLELTDAIGTPYQMLEKAEKLNRQTLKEPSFAYYMSLLFSLVSTGFFTYATLKFREIRQIAL